MEKIEFEHEIMKVLIKAGFVKGDQVVDSAIITIKPGEIPEVDLSFKVTD